MTRTYAVRQIEGTSAGYEFVNAPGIKFNDGVPKVRPQSKTNVTGALRIAAAICASKVFEHLLGILRKPSTAEVVEAGEA